VARKSKSPKAPSKKRLRRWHRLFGLLLTDHFLDSPFSVVLEMDLSQRQQLLDVVVVRRRPGVLTCPLPDGLEDLADHNLITFKSFQEALTDWSLKELTGHYVNYRKQVSPRRRLLSEDQFRLIAVCARRPVDLFDALPAEPVQAGVYLCRRGTDTIRIVVAVELPKEARNALLHLFTAAPVQVQYGVEHYTLRSPETSSIINDLFREYHVEGLPMPYTMQDYLREVMRKHIDKLTPEERVAGLSPEEILKGFSPEQIEAYLRRLASNKPAASQRNKPRRKS
jgi:hypothetical protein